MHFHFPEQFIFGAATSSFQIEGQLMADGAQPDIWNTFCRKELAITNGQNGNFACNHYNLWPQDIRIMKKLGLDSYRFSVSWARILAEGNGHPNKKGLDFYDRLVDQLLESGIRPMLTLYHWDLPQLLQSKGGWSNAGSPDWFSNYTQAVAGRLGDRVNLWNTFNEPWVFMHLGMITGKHAPGYRDPEHAAAAYKHILLAHCRSVQVLRACNSNHEIGFACNISPFYPDSEDPADMEACRRMHDYHNRLFLDPWLKCEIPSVAAEVFGKHMYPWTEEELSELNTQVDFVGVNYYTPLRVGYDPDAFFNVATKPPRQPVTDMNWEIYPKGLYETLNWLHESYGVPLYVTENGCAYPDEAANGSIPDKRRIKYLHSHLQQCSRAIAKGIPLKGYYLWSLLDNFEWSYGYKKRFGIVHVDFDTQKRTIKDSGYYYRDLIAEHKQYHRLNSAGEDVAEVESPSHKTANS